MWVMRNFFLSHSNAPMHNETIATQFLSEKIITVSDHLLYSPDLSPPDYFLFLKLKLQQKEHTFD